MKEESRKKKALKIFKTVGISASVLILLLVTYVVSVKYFAKDPEVCDAEKNLLFEQIEIANDFKFYEGTPFQVIGTFVHVCIRVQTSKGWLSIGSAGGAIFVPDFNLAVYCTEKSPKFKVKPSVAFEGVLSEEQARFLTKVILKDPDHIKVAVFPDKTEVKVWVFPHPQFKYSYFATGNARGIYEHYHGKPEDKKCVHCGSFVSAFLYAGDKKSQYFSKNSLPWLFRHYKYMGF